ncbi:MAG: molecular chaperone [Rhodobacterales bacterium]
MRGLANGGRGNWRFIGVLLLSCLILPLASAKANADGLRVSPTTLEVVAPGAATALTLINQGRTPVTVQARVFRWIQRDGREFYEPTNDVVVSPPMTQLAPGTQQAIRVVRTSRQPVQAEETYRVYIDQIRSRTQGQGGTVSFTSRLRIPVFFVAPTARPPQVQWSFHGTGAQAVLQARNLGDVRLRIADLRVMAGGSTMIRQDGLFAYVLGGSVMQWQVGSASTWGAGALSVKAATNAGDLNVPVARQ